MLTSQNRPCINNCSSLPFLECGKFTKINQNNFMTIGFSHLITCHRLIVFQKKGLILIKSFQRLHILWYNTNLLPQKSGTIKPSRYESFLRQKLFLMGHAKQASLAKKGENGELQANCIVMYNCIIH